MNRASIPVNWLPQYNYKDYEKWEGDWELIHGIPFSMSPSPKRKHQLYGRRFMRLMEDALLSKGSSCTCEVYYELDWIVDENTIVRPDIMIVCGEFEEDFLRFPPTLILEIGSDRTRLKDRNIKFTLYQSNGVKYYVMADIEKNNIEIFMLKDNYYQEVNTTSFQLTASCTIELNLETIWQ